MALTEPYSENGNKEKRCILKRIEIRTEKWKLKRIVYSENVLN